MRKRLAGILWLVHSFALSQPGSRMLLEDYVRSSTAYLCSPELHGRGYVKKGDSLAAAFISREFESFGLKPLKGSYFQQFQHSVNTFPGKMLVISEGDTLVPGQDFLVDPSCPTARLVLRFKRISPAEALNMVQLQKIIGDVVSGGSRYNAFVLDKRNASPDTLKLLNGTAKMLASFAHTIVWTNEKLTWSVASEQMNYPLLYVQGNVTLQREISIDIQAQLVRNYVSYNVVGFLPASRPSRKTLVLTAHYDHLGRMGAKTYFPGANDNASGTSTLLAVCKELTRKKRKFNYLIIAFAGEEAGLVGSKYFTAHPLLKLKKIRFLINLDIMGSGEDGITVVNATKQPKEFSLLQKVNAEKNYLTQVKSRGPAANSDHYWFSEKGVPAFFIYTMGPNKNYHDIYDTYTSLSFAETNDLVDLILDFFGRF
jgi:aminopeptidase YwaD